MTQKLETGKLGGGLGMKAHETIYQLFIGLLLAIIASTMILPFLYVIIISFTDSSVYVSGTFYLWPQKWSTEAYRLILRGSGFLNALKASVFITFVGTPINVCANAGLAYMLSKDDLVGRSLINKLVMFTMLFGAGMIPNFINIRNLGLINNWFANILPSACGAWTVMVMKSFFSELPKDIEEAAEIDGCSTLRMFFQIVLPLSLAMLATFTLFAFVSYWNCYFSAILYLTDTTKMPLQVYLQKIVLSTDISEVVDIQDDLRNKVPQEIMRMASLVVVVFPILCIYPFMQKYFAKGVMVGAVKG
ncbi:MAG: carbohydrate ABC transporter permease [Clostridia bacterium]|nr:carbohydrate ABC transporter permease [Clostridia bacterium]